MAPTRASYAPDLDKLDWMVVADLFEHETASFWKRPGADPARIPTEVFVLPATSGVEKEGSIVNSGRWVQWRYQAIKPIANCRPDLDIVDGLAKAMKRAYEKDGVFPEPIRHLAWDYGDHADPHRVARELNGRFLVDVTEKDGKTFAAGKQVPGFAQLRDDGSTMSGNWIYCGGYTEEGNLAARREMTDAPNGIQLYPNWAWVWPMNRRILYNRASVNRKGEPFNPRKWVIRWDAENKKWEGDVPDGAMPPGETNPFIMLASGSWAALLAGPGRWPLSRTLRAGGEPGQKSVLENPVESVRADLAVQRIRSLRQTRCFSDRRHDVSSFRTLADRRDEPQHAMARGPRSERLR